MITDSTEVVLSHYPLPPSATVQPKSPLLAFLTQGTFTIGLAAKTACLHLDKREENIQNIEKSMYVGMQVTVCVRPLMYMNTGICVCKFCMCVLTFAKL